ncbi:hypothetical protein NP233_g1335 [Leucocoprinus birnbaumii]|uniref:Fermentation associated protein n=1 Tax=Leucocoprinus birnbaumii TaxID=56174 RepID=A0AAD5W2F8_9AGAR|nr:hypothetical protein NP233_g1335 [Leucocoprinus birnbaumii]
MLTRLLLISCICIVVALILYFFYFNRILGFALGLMFRLLYWNQEGSSLWLEIGSIHFSLLTGRILLKDVHYHSSNQTIKIVKGQIQWRYWIRRPMTGDELYVRGEENQHSRLPSCRIQITLQGFEWFLYNRTAAYDSILAQMEESLGRNISRSTDRNRSSQRLNRFESMPSRAQAAQKRALRVPATIQQLFTWLKQQMPVLDPKELLPLGIQVSKGVITCGNLSTPSLLVAEFSVCQGTFGITQARSQYDLYKQILALRFRNAVIQFAENEQFVDPMSTIGGILHDRVDQYPTLRNASSYLSYRSFQRIWRQLTLFPLTHKYGQNRQRQRNFKASSARSHSKQGKTQEEETHVGADFSALEYAIERKILESPLLELTYLVDVVGEVPPIEAQAHAEAYEYGNGDIPPDWVLEFVIHGGFFRYGPWADRQRAEIQKAFFPPTYQTAEQTRPLEPGDKRMWTALQIFVELRNETTLHIPFREASKDWQWDGFSEVPKRSRRREPASINVAVGDRSSINYLMPVVAGRSGYDSVFEVHLDDVSVTSSLNDIHLIHAESCRVHGDLPSPLKWNEERTWAFDITFRQPILYLLRDHINMFTDLGRDWSSGPPSDWARWVPTIYTVNLNLYRYEINLYANDQNIIDKPLAREDNALLTLRGERFDVKTTIPSNKFRPESTNVEFVTRVPNVSADFSLPRWNTRAAYIPKEGCNLAKVGLVVLRASYLYHAETREELVDHLTLDFEATDLINLMLGWSIRYWMVLRDNYLGSFTNFSTLYEYIDKRKKDIPAGDPINLKYREGKSNMFQCTMTVAVKGAALVLPAGVLGIEAPQAGGTPGTGPCLVLSVPEFQLHLRLHDFFLEMSCNVPTLYGHIDHSFPRRFSYERTTRGQRIMSIDGLDIVANRLFGPMPRTSTYLCIWEFTTGHMKLDMTLADAQLLSHIGRSFGLGFVDLTNAPAAEFMPPIDPDITFYKLNVKSLETVLRANGTALQVLCKFGVRLDSNDVGGVNYSKLTGLRIPHIGAKVLLNASVERDAWLEAVDITSDLYIDIYAAPKGFKDHIERQRTFVSEQDRLTDRVARMLSRMEGTRKLHKNGVYLPQPQLPNPRRPRVRIIQPQPRKPTLPPHLRRGSAPGNISDSDAEELVSEADRDARLARTRTSTPVHVVDDEQQMSSGDESDDADLTDGGSTDSAWTDNEDRELGRDGAMLMYYTHLTRHYSSLRRNDHRFWETSSFTLTKDRGRNFAPKLAESDMAGAQRSTTGPLQIPTDLERGSTTIRLQFRRPLEVKLTPLLVPVSVHLQETLCSVNHGPELEVEALIAECSSFIISMTKDKDRADSRRIVEVTCPLINLQIIQSLSMSEDGHPRISPHLKDSFIPSKLDAAMEISLSIQNLTLNGVFSKSSTKIHPFIHTMSLRLSTLSKSIPTSSTDDTIFDCRFSGLDVDLQPNRVHLGWVDMTTSIGYRGPELVTAVVINMKHGLSRILKTLHLIEEHNKAAMQAVIHQIIDLSEPLTIIDPLSTIQPSYLIQEGIPHALRTDSTFRFLFHLRNCLRHLQTQDRNHIYDIQGNIDSVNPDAFTSALHSRFVHLDQDLDAVYDLVLLEQLLKIRRPKSTTPTPNKIPSFSINLQNTCLRVLASTSSSVNEFLVTGVEAHTRSYPLDLIQHAFGHPASMSQTSLRERRPHLVKRISLQFAAEGVYFTVYSHLMDFVQLLLRVRRIYMLHLASVPPKHKLAEERLAPPSISRGSSSLYVDASVLLRSVKLQAAAANLIFEIGAQALQTITLLSLPTAQGDESLNMTLLFDKFYLQARTPFDKMKSATDQGVLAVITLAAGKANAVMRQEQTLKRHAKVVFSLGGLHLSVPRSAMKLYRFVEEWRADFLPGIERAVKAVLSELRLPSTKIQSPAPSIRSLSKRPWFQINGQVIEIGISLQVMHGTWLSWQANNVVTYLQSPPDPLHPSNIAFGLQISFSTIEVLSKENVQEAASESRVKLAFPALSLGGGYDGRSVGTHVIIESLDLKVKPSHWDTLLIVQQKFGKDFNDFVALMEETRLKSSSKPQRTSKPKSNPKLMFTGYLKMRGFRIGFEGRVSTMFLECQDIGGGLRIDNSIDWDIGLTDLALSLAPRSGGSLQESFDRGRRSVFVIIDIKVVTGKQKKYPFAQSLELVVTKAHAVMHPSSIGEIGDFLDHLQADILERKEQRAQELAAFKQKTQSIMKTLEVKTRDAHVEESPWYSKYLIGITIRDLGIAFPITLEQDIQLPRFRAKDAAISAFLFSISSIAFGINRGETGQAALKDLSFQFISHFRQSEPSHYSGGSHRTRNRLVYPEMTAQLRSVLRADARQLWIDASVSGFILDLDSTVTSYIFSLIDVYRQGKERLDQLSNSVVRSPSSEVEETEVVPPDKHYSAIPTSNIFASLKFLSGKVRVYSSAATRLYRKRTQSVHVTELSDEQILELGAEVFNLPVVSVWAEYRATPALRKRGGSQDQDPPTLMFKSTVHSSRNTLRPTLLPFLTELVNHIESRMRTVSTSKNIQSPILSQSSSIISIDKEDALNAVNSMRISFSLRIDRSQLEFSCLPDVNVAAALRWESGGFIINLSPGVRQVTFTGTVGGLSIGLKHGYLSEDCLQLDARNLVFSVSFNKLESLPRHTTNSISVVLDTEFHGRVKLSRLQDILCFKAVWLDLFPLFNNQPSEDVKTPLKSTPTPSYSTLPPVKQSFSTVLLLRAREINLEVDLGQSISRVTLQLNQTILRSNLTENFNEVAVYVGELLIVADGNLSGHVRVCDCLFRTVRKTESQPLEDLDGRMLELRLTSGPLIAVLESDRQRLLHYHAEPLEVEVYDDWKSGAATTDQGNPLQLSFIVTSPEIVAAVTIGTIPKLMSYANKFEANLEAQRDGASRESAAFRGSRSLKPENPLSAVAEAMLHTAKTKFKETESRLSFIVRQVMSLQLDHLRLAVFPRSMEDSEMAQFVARDVRAHLARLVATVSTPSQRDLRLSFASMNISKYTHNQLLNLPLPGEDKCRTWLEDFVRGAMEATIVGLPSMKMHMSSEERVDNIAKKLIYDFNSVFIRQGQKDVDDIFISLNVSLYSWLTLLRKNMTREIDQVRATAEWRTSLNSGVGSPVMADKNKQTPDGGAVDLPSKSASLPSTGTISPSLSSMQPRSATAYAPEIPPANVSTDHSPAILQPTTPVPFPAPASPPSDGLAAPKHKSITYEARDRFIERLTMRQLGEATPDVMHPFFMKKAGFNLEDSLPQYVNEYATAPLEEIMEVLLKLYSRQLKVDKHHDD